jgi:hypothetical protein
MLLRHLQKHVFAVGFVLAVISWMAWSRQPLLLAWQSPARLPKELATAAG